MRQPPPSGNSPGPQPGRDGGLPGGRDPRLASFASSGAGDRHPPGTELGMVLDELSGPDHRCQRATDEELIGLLGRWAAQESWVAAGKLGVIRELVRRRALPGHAYRRYGDLPDMSEEGTGHEVAAALAVSVPAADGLIDLACTLRARLPGIGAKLADGTIDTLKAKIIAKELSVLDDWHALQAEALIIGELAGKTPGQIGTLAATAAVTVDPQGAQRRREQAETDDARIRFWREQAGTAALAGYGLPTDAALAANANINHRAQAYKRAKLDGTMDQLRVLAYLDILNGIPAHDRIAQARAQADAQAGQAQPVGNPVPAGHDAPPGPAAGSWPHTFGNGGAPAGNGPAGNGPAGDGPAGNGPAGNGPTGSGTVDEDPTGNGAEDEGKLDDEPVDDGSRDDGDLDADGTSDGESGGEGPGRGPDGDGPGGGDSRCAPDPAPEPVDGGPALAASTNLTIPLATLQGLAARPAQGHGLGPLDPGLARNLAKAAARSPHSTWCITITSPEGYAIGHGCAKPARTKGAKSPPANSRDGPWAFTPRDDPGPSDGYGSWTLTLPGGRQLAVKLGPVPVGDCDHRHEAHGYQPSDTLRHLVQIRDSQCTFPACSRHARESDFEHALPYDKGGKTCGCNAGARSRRCHKVKQSRGWKVTEPRPGWHEWTTPSGRTYVQGPMKYPA